MSPTCELQNIVSMHFDESDKPEICPAVFAPVTGLEGDFGPLAVGDWALVGPFGMTRPFAVVPEPTTLVMVLVAVGIASLRGYRVGRSSPN